MQSSFLNCCDWAVSHLHNYETPIYPPVPCFHPSKAHSSRFLFTQFFRGGDAIVCLAPCLFSLAPNVGVGLENRHVKHKTASSKHRWDNFPIRDVSFASPYRQSGYSGDSCAYSIYNGRNSREQVRIVYSLILKFHPTSATHS